MAEALGGFGEIPPGELRHGVASTRDPGQSKAENVGRDAGSTGVAANGRHGRGFAVLSGSLCHAAGPNLLHGLSVIGLFSLLEPERNGGPEAYYPLFQGSSNAEGSAVCRRVDGTAIGLELERAQVVLYHADLSMRGKVARSVYPRLAAPRTDHLGLCLTADIGAPPGEAVPTAGRSYARAKGPGTR